MQHFTQYPLHKVLGHSYLLNVNKIWGGGVGCSIVSFILQWLLKIINALLFFKTIIVKKRPYILKVSVLLVGISQMWYVLDYIKPFAIFLTNLKMRD